MESESEEAVVKGPRRGRSSKKGSNDSEKKGGLAISGF